MVRTFLPAAALVAAFWLAGCGDDPAPPTPPAPAVRDAGNPPTAVDAAPAPTVPDAAADAAAPNPSDGPLSGDAQPADGPTPMSMIRLYDVPAPVAEACQRYAEVQCARWKECTPGRFLLDYNSDELCRARRDSACRADFLVVGRLETPADRAACTDAYGKASCRDLFFNRRIPACEAPPGSLTQGQACFRTSQCARGLNCQVEVESCGTCQPAIAAGGDCGWWATGCPAGTACWDDRCLPTLKAAEACKTTSAPCEDGLACLTTGCAEKTAEMGASCSAGDLCDPMKGLHCNYTTGVCEPLPAPVPVGERCGTYTPGGGPLECGADGTCYAESTAIGAIRRCVARADLGQACDPATGRGCKVPLACTRGVCVMPTVVTGGMYMPTMCR
jgi:hypothetical protein